MGKLSLGQAIELLSAANRGALGNEVDLDYEWLLANKGANWRRFVTGLRRGDSVAVDAASLMTSSDDMIADQNEWKRLFKVVRIQDSNFNSQHFPLEPVNLVQPIIRKQFTGKATGWKRLQWAKENGLELARARTTGAYFQTNPDFLFYVSTYYEIVGGGEWKVGGDSHHVFVPISRLTRDIPWTKLQDLSEVFGPQTIWLFSPVSSNQKART